MPKSLEQTFEEIKGIGVVETPTIKKFTQAELYRKVWDEVVSKMTDGHKEKIKNRDFELLNKVAPYVIEKAEQLFEAQK